MRVSSALTAIALAGAISVPAVAQQTNQLPLVGTWTLKAVYDQFTDGHRRNPWGNNPQGSIIFTSNGIVSQQIMAGDRSPQPRTAPFDPVGRAIAFFGTYTVGGANKSYTIHIQQCTWPQWNGVSRTANIEELSSTTLKTVSAPIHDPQGGEFQPHLQWERVN
jgi:hypothetical protein